MMFSHPYQQPHRQSDRTTRRASELRLLISTVVAAAASHAASAQPILPITQDRRVTASCTCGCIPSTRSALTFGLFSDSVSASGSSGGGVGQSQAAQNSTINPYGLFGSGDAFTFGMSCLATAASIYNVTFTINHPQSYSIRVNPISAGNDLRPTTFGLFRGQTVIFSGAVVINDPFVRFGIIEAGTYQFSLNSSSSANQFPNSSGSNYRLRIYPDECGQAVQVTGAGPFEFDNTDALAVLAPPEPLCDAPGDSGFGHDIWFRFTAAGPGRVSVATCGLTSIDTKLALYPDTCPNDPGTALACNDNACGIQSRVTTRVIPRRNYLVRIGTPPSAPGGIGAFRIDSCPCDFDASGQINSADFFDFLSAFLSVHESADFNADARIDTTDFFDFLTCFFSPPAAC